MQSGFIIVLAALAGAMVVTWLSLRNRNASAAIAARVPELDVEEAARLIRQKQAVVVDVRTSAEYAAGRIPDATHVPLRHLPERLDGLRQYRNHPIVVSCRTGRRSASACSYLSENGFQEVYNLRGGLHAWVQARHAVEN